MVIQEERIAKNAEEALGASNKQSRAALNQTIQSSHLEQRAWVIASGFKLSEEPSLNKDFRITIQVLNTGKTPALEMVNQSTILFWNAEPPRVTFAQPKNVISKGILPPGITGHSFTTDPMKLTRAEQMEAYTNKTSKIYLQALARYKDTFDNPHWMRICAFHTSGDPLDTFQYCQEGNEVDQDKRNQVN